MKGGGEELKEREKKGWRGVALSAWCGRNELSAFLVPVVELEDVIIA